MPYKDPEKRREYNKKWRQENEEYMKEQQKEYQKKWYEKNKEQKKEYVKQYQKKNEEHIKEYLREYLKTDNGKKSKCITKWKQQGMINDDFDNVYDIYINTHTCDYCNTQLNEGDGGNKRCLDHDHNTGEIRGILCMRCNIKDVLNI